MRYTENWWHFINPQPSSCNAVRVTVFVFLGVFLSTVYAYCGTLYTLVLETNVLKRYSVKKQCIITGLPRPGFICSAHRGGIIITVCIESIGAQNAITVTVRLGSQYVALCGVAVPQG